MRMLAHKCITRRGDDFYNYLEHRRRKDVARADEIDIIKYRAQQDINRERQREPLR